MRVTIEHREESAGLTGSTKHHFVDCAVQFGEEEKAIINSRDLRGTNFTVNAANPLPSNTEFLGTGALNMLGRIGVIVGIPFGFISPFIGGSAGTIAGLMVFFGACAWIYSAFVIRKQDKTIEQREQTVTIGDLLKHGRFSVHAASPAHAQVLEDDIKQHLSDVKNVIKNSAELKQSQTFEL